MDKTRPETLEEALAALDESQRQLSLAWAALDEARNEVRALKDKWPFLRFLRDEHNRLHDQLRQHKETNHGEKAAQAADQQL